MSIDSSINAANESQILISSTESESFWTTLIYTSIDETSSTITTLANEPGGHSLPTYMHNNWIWILAVTVSVLLLVIAILVICKLHQTHKDEEEERNVSDKIRKEASNTIQLTSGSSFQSAAYSGDSRSHLNVPNGGKYRKDTEEVLAAGHASDDDYYFNAMSQKNHAQEALKEDLEIMTPDSQRRRGDTDAQFADMMRVLSDTVDRNDSEPLQEADESADDNSEKP